MIRRQLARTLDALRVADIELERALGSPRSLAPDRARASRLRELGAQLLEHEQDETLLRACAHGVPHVIRAQVHNFPSNLFWDFDLPFAELVAAARRSDNPLARMQQLCFTMASLHELFGMHSELRFQYAHDFIYGFDWSKWLRRDPRARIYTRPFELGFLRALHGRGHELRALIAGNDRAHPPLPETAARNPFSFSRTPAHEALLLSQLAEAELIPAQAWDMNTNPIWNAPFAESREQRARELGLLKD